MGKKTLERDWSHKLSSTQQLGWLGDGFLSSDVSFQKKVVLRQSPDNAKFEDITVTEPLQVYSYCRWFYPPSVGHFLPELTWLPCFSIMNRAAW